MELKCGVYCIKSISNIDRIYVGSSSKIEARWDKHLRDLKYHLHHSVKLQRHYNKYGKEDLIFEILEECPKENLERLEQFYIDKILPYFNSTLFVYNLNRGIPWNKGLKGITTAWNKGKKMPEEQHLRMFGRKLSEETKLKISMTKKGVKSSIESIAKRSIKLKKPVLQYDKNMQYITEYSSIKEANIVLGIAYQHIGACCRGERKSAGGFIWKFKEAITNVSLSK